MNTRQKQSFTIIRILITAAHAAALLAFIVGIYILYTNENFKKDLLWSNEEIYEDSPAFTAAFEEDVDRIFDYIETSGYFETAGVYDPDKALFVTEDGPDEETEYTAASVIETARLMGFELDPECTVISAPESIAGYDSSAFVEEVAYPVTASANEPGDRFYTMKELIPRVLGDLGRYFRAKNRLYEDSNISFSVKAGRSVYTNDKKLTAGNAADYGRYAYINSGDVGVKTNLPNIPNHLSYKAQTVLASIGPSYAAVIAVDTDYPYSDYYTEARNHYLLQRSLYFTGLMHTFFGALVMLITIVILSLMTGRVDSTSEEIRLTYFDRRTPEMRIVMCLIGCILAIFFADNVLKRLIHIFLPTEGWVYAEQIGKYVLIYLVTALTVFSLIRSYKADRLFEDTELGRAVRRTGKYFRSDSFAVRLTSVYFAFTLGLILLTASASVLIVLENTLIHRFIIIALIILLISIVIVVWLYTYRHSMQQDEIRKAVSGIERGDMNIDLNPEDFDGSERGVVESLNHISEGFRSALTEQVKSERMKADLITNVSHDIRTPLTSIINYVDLMKREEPKEPKIREYLDILDQKSQHLKSLTEDLLEASKVSSGNVKLDMQKIDLAELIIQAEGEFEERYAAAGLEIISSSPEAPVMIEADGNCLWRVLENIFGNACKYAARGSRVYSDLAVQDGRAEYILKNISASRLNINPAELTERFVRGDVSRTTEGNGLGLSIADSLTKLQGGSFRIEIDGDLFKAVISFPLADSE